MAEMTYKHGSPDRVTNRTCHYDADDNDWYYTPAAAIKGTQIKCPWEHPQLNTLAALGPQKFLEDPSEGRGDFGMPIMGSAWRITGGEVPNDSTSIDMPLFKMIVEQQGIKVDYGENGYMEEATTDDAEYILTKVLPGLLSKFLRNNTKYARAQDRDLGMKGIVPDINRKTSVLVSRLWDGADVVGEDTDEIIDDLIGHLLLMRAKMRDM